MKKRRLIAAIALAAGLCATLPASEAEWRQQFSGWFSLNDDKPSTPRFGLRYQPTFSLAASMSTDWQLDGEASLDMSASGSAAAWRDLDVSGKIKPYRLWLRLSSPRFEARLGLQKINFGSAMLFRPLMWFDRIDPRDPLQISDGVYGLLLRCFFKDNANLWLWGLYGNTGTKGWETLPTASRTPEFGGRFQVPLFSGEAGITGHLRRVPVGDEPAAAAANESRFALDGKWDLGIGLWAETAFVHLDDPAAAFSWQRSLAVGVDYTFKLGNGLYLLAEQFFSGGSASPLGGGNSKTSLSALLARYPLGLLDTLAAVFYFDWQHEQLYNFVSWQRTIDRWQFHLMAFWNPRQVQIIRSQPGNNTFSGRGFQLLVVCNL